MIRKIILSSSLSLPKGVNRQFSCFSKEKMVRNKKIQTVGFAGDKIQNIKSLSFKPEKPIQFQNGRYLLYRRKSSALRVIRDYFLHFSALSYFTYNLYYAINFLAYPVIKHVYISGIGITLFMTARRFLRNQNVVKQLYLLQGGKATQIIFQNKLKRKLFGQHLSQTLYNSLFSTPKQRQNIIIGLNQFPQTSNELQEPSFLQPYWKKYCSNQENMFLIPTNYEYMDKQILVIIYSIKFQVMQGKVIIPY